MNKLKCSYEQYKGNFAKQYMDAQEKFHAKSSDVTWERILQEIDFPLAGKKVLDAGCGYGRYLKYFQEKDASYYGIDGSNPMIRLAKRLNPGIENLFVRDIENTGFQDGFFDLVFSRFAIQHAEDMNPLFQEIHRILSPGGYFIFVGNHPMMMFEYKKGGNYFEREVIGLDLFDRTLTVYEPTHTLEEHLNDFVLKNFQLMTLSEDSCSPGEVYPIKNRTAKLYVPEFILMKFKK